MLINFRFKTGKPVLALDFQQMISLFLAAGGQRRHTEGEKGVEGGGREGEGGRGGGAREGEKQRQRKLRVE